MSENKIYETIAKRCGGDVYVGVVGPVRTGKSTFIHRFMESVVLPNIPDEYERERALDEIPQSGSGKTITTTEPKFVPCEAVRVNLDGTDINIRMIDCVGYMVDGAMGAMEEDEWRMVVTPWSEEPMPFVKAAEMGTEKVVREHSTIAMLVTTDGSITDIPRESYIEAEERVARELKEAEKPFAIILNSREPESEAAQRLAIELEEKYGAPVALVNCTRLNADDVGAILELVVGEFPVRELRFSLPDWTSLLPTDHEITRGIFDTISTFADSVKKFSDVKAYTDENGKIARKSLDAGSGKGEFSIELGKDEYYSAMSELSGERLDSDKALFAAVIEMAEAKREYEKVKSALLDVKERGYGIVMPNAEELKLSEPELIKQSGGYGVKVSAEAESIHMIKTKIRADVCPTFASAEQSEEVIKTMNADYEEDPKQLLESKMFGRSLYELVNDGMHSKLMHMSDESRAKMSQTLERIINEGASGLICILL
ncbi:MAG: stage IV sporulation protein A [Ruminococcaceae bacterium]|nr:stage IV sporulation protein A [Oscillospiraceae bacterium]